MTCKLPVVLEGPAAVGKTSLVSAVCSAQGLDLLRVSNSESTTLQVGDFSWLHVLYIQANASPFTTIN
jgi:MoxR-like ATPase